MHKQCCKVYSFMLANTFYFQIVHNVNQQLQKCDLIVLMIADNTTVITGLLW